MVAIGEPQAKTCHTRSFQWLWLRGPLWEAVWTVVPPKICFNKIFIEFKSNFELILGNNGNLRVYSVVNVPLKEFPGDRSCLFYKINTQKEVAIFEPDTRPTQTPNVCKLEPQIPSILNWASGKLCIFLQVWQSNMHPRNQTGLSFLTKGNCGSPGYRFFLSHCSDSSRLSQLCCRLGL